MKIKCVTLIIAILILDSLFVFAEQNGNFEDIVTDTIDGVIIPQDKAKNFYCNTKIEYFTPNREDVLRAEQRFIEYLAQYQPEEKYLILPSNKELLNYQRQYVGLILDGRKKIWINFFHRMEEGFPIQNDKHGFVRVEGGGNWFFDILFDVESSNFSGLNINGPK